MPHADDDKHWMKFFWHSYETFFHYGRVRSVRKDFRKNEKIKVRGREISATGLSERKILALPSKREKYIFGKCKGREGEG